MAQRKGEKIMEVPITADGFRAAVRALRSLDGKDGVSLHTFTLPEDRCARLMVKNLGRGMPESVVREELESAAIRPPPRTALPPHTSLYQWREGLRLQKCDLSPTSAACECRCSVYCSKRLAAMQALTVLRPHAA